MPVGITLSRAVSPKDSALNDTINNVIGNKTDTHSGDSLYSKLEVNTEHYHSPAKMYPTLANGVTVTASAAGWTLGNFVEVIPASTVAEDFDIHYISVEAISANDVFELVLYAATTEVGRCRFSKAAAQEGTQNIPMQTDIIPANTQIQAKLACKSANARTIDIALFYHEY